MLVVERVEILVLVVLDMKKRHKPKMPSLLPRCSLAIGGNEKQ